MIRRRIAAVALAAGCLLSQTGCTGFGSNTNTCPPSNSGCCLTSGGGLFSRMFGSPAPAAACCPPPCAPVCAASPCSSGAPVMTSGYDAGAGAPIGGSPGCGCNRDPFQFTGMQGAAPAPIMTTMPGPIMQGAPINVGPDMTQPIPSVPYNSGPPPIAPMPNQGPRIVPVPQMPQSPVPAGAYGTQPWIPGH